MKVLEKCHLREAVREKEEGLDALGTLSVSIIMLILHVYVHKSVYLTHEKV